MSDSPILGHFTFFPLLPREIRLMIWFYALPPFRRIDREIVPHPPPAIFSTCLESQEVFLSHYSKLKAVGALNLPGFYDFTLDTFEVGLVPWFDQHISTLPPTETSMINKVWMETDCYGLKGNILNFFRRVYRINPQIVELTLFVIPKSKSRPFFSNSDRILRHKGASLSRPCWNYFLKYTGQCKETWAAKGWEWKLPKLFVVENLTEGSNKIYSSGEERSFEEMVGNILA